MSVVGWAYRVAQPGSGTCQLRRRAANFGWTRTVSERLRLLVLGNKSPGLAPGQRYRFEQWAPRLDREHGITLELVPFESPALSALLYEPGHHAAKAGWILRDFARRFSAIRAAAKYDAVLVYREAALVGPPIFERMLSALGCKIIPFRPGIGTQSSASTTRPLGTGRSAIGAAR